jgi:post-segregation antitoxin (ccd killing protein)
MPPISTIPNKTSITLSIDAQKRDFCKENGINISLLLDAALERETNPKAEKHFAKAIKRQNHRLREFIKEHGLQNNYQDYLYGGAADVVEEEPQQANKSAVGSFAGI